MPTRTVPVLSPSNGDMAIALDEAIGPLTDEAVVELLFDIDKWALTVESGRARSGLLNNRYELCVLEGHPPSKWIVGAYDTQTTEFMLAVLLSGGARPDRQRAGELCAKALNEPIRSLTA